MALSCAGALAQQPGRPGASKLSLHLIGDYKAGARQVVAAGPRVLKILDLQASMLEAVRDYKAKYPTGAVVLRIYTSNSYSLANDPVASANNYWDAYLWPQLNALSPTDRALIDYVEGPNEGNTTPAWNSVQEATWYGQFCARLCVRMQERGFKPVVGNIPVSNPPGDPTQIGQLISAFMPALTAAQTAGGAWSYHSYVVQRDATGYSQSVGTEVWYSLRYRLIHDAIASANPSLTNMTCILTEGGVDQSGDPNLSGWQARGTMTEYMAWLRWFDRQLRTDSYVLGCTLFQAGCPWGWYSFETEPINAWLAGHIRSSRGWR